MRRQLRRCSGVWTASPFAAALLLGTLLPASAPAQPQPADLPLDAGARTQVIDQILGRLRQSYVLPEVAAQMESSVRARVAKGEYDAITSSTALAEALTTHLREISKDKHLSVGFRSEPIPATAAPTDPTPEERERFRRMAASINFGFEKVERRSGNIGYIELNAFFPADLAADTAIAAMGFVANTDALIIDLRYNGGGVPGLNQLISTYFFSGKPVLLHSVYWREEDRTEQFWTLPHVPGKRYADKPVYILTSRATMSAPEGFAYSLQAQKRATIVGQTTAGGANPFKEFRLTEHFAAYVPTGRAINPVTGANWEGAGVKPDIEVPADQALHTAHLHALKRLRDAATSDREKAKFQSAIEEVEKPAPAPGTAPPSP